MPPPGPELDLLIPALREASASLAETPLYKSGKQPGLFSRTGPPAQAAQRALEEGLLELVRTDGKTDWVRITSRGIEFLKQHESPREALEELLAELRRHRDGLPLWIEQLSSSLRALVQRLEDSLAKQSTRMEQLLGRAEAALARIDLPAPAPGGGLAAWQLDLLALLPREERGASLGDLFRALAVRHPRLSLSEFHDGVLALRDRGGIELIPGDAASLPEPEFALIEGQRLFQAARRR